MKRILLLLVLTTFVPIATVFARSPVDAESLKSTTKAVGRSFSGFFKGLAEEAFDNLTDEGLGMSLGDSAGATATDSNIFGEDLKGAITSAAGQARIALFEETLRKGFEKTLVGSMYDFIQGPVSFKKHLALVLPGKIVQLTVNAATLGTAGEAAEIGFRYAARTTGRAVSLFVRRLNNEPAPFDIWESVTLSGIEKFSKELAHLTAQRYAPVLLTYTENQRNTFIDHVMWRTLAASQLYLGGVSGRTLSTQEIFSLITEEASFHHRRKIGGRISSSVKGMFQKKMNRDIARNVMLMSEEQLMQEAERLITPGTFKRMVRAAKSKLSRSTKRTAAAAA